MIFKNAFNTLNDDFITLYKNYFSRTESLQEIPRVINTGDCGTFAAAFYFILSVHFPKLKIYENENHAFLEYDGLYYDSSFSEGISLQDMQTAYNVDRSTIITVEQLFQSFSYIDPVGCRLIRGFCNRWGATIDPLYESVIANELEYDSEDWLVQFRTHEETMKSVRKNL